MNTKFLYRKKMNTRLKETLLHTIDSESILSFIRLNSTLSLSLRHNI